MPLKSLWVTERYRCGENSRDWKGLFSSRTFNIRLSLRPLILTLLYSITAPISKLLRVPHAACQWWQPYAKASLIITHYPWAWPFHPQNEQKHNRGEEVGARGGDQTVQTCKNANIDETTSMVKTPGFTNKLMPWRDRNVITRKTGILAFPVFPERGLGGRMKSSSRFISSGPSIQPCLCSLRWPWLPFKQWIYYCVIFKSKSVT